jgi:hypothetical protein
MVEISIKSDRGSFIALAGIRFKTEGVMGTCEFLKKVSAGVLFGAMGLAFSEAASATAGYCVNEPGYAVTTDGLSLSDVTFTIGSTDYGPVDCYGITDTGASNIATALPFVNALRWEDFVNGVKDDLSAGSNTVTVDSIQYTLTAGTLSGGGLTQTQSWSLAWSDTNGTAEPNLPLLVNFALDWKGGNNDVFYYFRNVLLPISPSSGSGTIDIKVTNRPGNSDLGTSHLDVFFSNTSPPTQPDDPPPTVPEPATIALIAAALMGVATASGRRKQPA